MANQELESRTIDLSEETMKSITFSLADRDAAYKLWSRLKENLKAHYPDDEWEDEGVMGFEYGSSGKLSQDLSEPYEEELNVPLYEKLMAGLLGGSLRNEKDPAIVSVDLIEKEIDYLNGLYFGRMIRQGIENPRAEARVKESREIFVELNLLWNKAGGTPRPLFLEFNG